MLSMTRIKPVSATLLSTQFSRSFTIPRHIGTLTYCSSRLAGKCHINYKPWQLNKRMIHKNLFSHFEDSKEFQFSQVPKINPSKRKSKPVKTKSNLVKRRVLQIFRSFRDEPFSSLASFAIIYEISGIVPLLSVWYLFYHHELFSSMFPISVFPDFLVSKATAVIDNVLQSTDMVQNFSVQSTTKLLMSGSKAFIVTRVLSPIRALLSFLLMDWFNNKTFRAISRRVKRNERTTVEPSNAKPEFKKLNNKKL